MKGLFDPHKRPVGADIDTLCVVPRYVTREDFFSVMHDMLKARPEVTRLTVPFFPFCSRTLLR